MKIERLELLKEIYEVAIEADNMSEPIECSLDDMCFDYQFLEGKGLIEIDIYMDNDYFVAFINLTASGVDVVEEYLEESKITNET